MFSILTKRKDGKLLDAVVYECSAQHANELSPDRRSLTAYTAKKFSRAFPVASFPEPSNKPKDSDLKKWIEKIESAPKPKYGGWRGKGESCTAELNTEEKNPKKMSWMLNTRADVRNMMVKAAKKRGLTITGLTETIIINWLNENEAGKKKIPAKAANNANRYSYILGQIAAKEYEILGNISFEGYLFDVPGKKLTSLKKSLIASYKYTEDIGRLYEAVPQTLITTRLNRRNYIWFFAGFCGVDWSVIAEQKL